jgi:hypothetical protein
MTAANRMKQASGEAAEFQQRFEQIVKDLHPDYERNKLVRGIRLEFLRELLPGVFASHNALCKKGTYFHGFCITLHREFPGPYLISPLVIGGRFNHNNSTKLAYFRDIEPTRKWPFGESNFTDSHSYRTGWDGIVQKCTRVAEERMLPHYLAKVMQNKEPLLHILEMLLALGEIPTDTMKGHGLPVPTGGPGDYDMQWFVARYRSAGKDRDHFLSNIIHSKPELFNKVRQMKTLPDLLGTLRS